MSAAGGQSHFSAIIKIEPNKHHNYSLHCQWQLVLYFRDFLLPRHNSLRIQHDHDSTDQIEGSLDFSSWVSKWAVSEAVTKNVNMKLWEALSWLPHPISSVFRDSWVPCHQLLVFLSPSTTTMGSLSASSSSSYYICLPGFTLYYTRGTLTISV